MVYRDASTASPVAMRIWWRKSSSSQLDDAVQSPEATPDDDDSSTTISGASPSIQPDFEASPLPSPEAQLQLMPTDPFDPPAGPAAGDSPGGGISISVVSVAVVAIVVPALLIYLAVRRRSDASRTHAFANMPPSNGQPHTYNGGFGGDGGMAQSRDDSQTAG